jgi:1-acyl-sn-glycerol-3-phosphate acyltransferase
MASDARPGIGDGLIRAAKGVAMFFMFCLFMFGIFLELLIVTPVLVVARAFGAQTESAHQAATRLLFGVWLSLMSVFGLLRTKPPIGRPVDGPCVVIANHPGLFDVVVLIRDIPRLSVMVKNSLRKKLPIGPMLDGMGYVCSPDLASGTPLDALFAATGVLARGNKFQLFPEGTRSPNGELRRFGRGAFLLARQANVSIQPILLRNEPPFLPREEPWYFPPRACSYLQIEYWAPVPPPERGQETELTKRFEQRYREALAETKTLEKGTP